MVRQHSRQSPSHKSQKRIIFLPILERKGESSKKPRIFGHPRRTSVLHESREPYPCHTFRSDAAEIFTPSRRLKATHAQPCNSCRLKACPNTRNHRKVFEFGIRNSLHLPRIITIRTPFSPNRRRKRCTVVTFHEPPSDIAQK